MKLSHERMVHLSRLFLDALQESPLVEFRADGRGIRLQMVRSLKSEQEKDEEIEREVRRKLASRKKPIPEGSQEWELLFRKYYEEALQKRFGSRR